MIIEIEVLIFHAFTQDSLSTEMKDSRCFSTFQQINYWLQLELCHTIIRAKQPKCNNNCGKWHKMSFKSNNFKNPIISSQSVRLPIIEWDNLLNEVWSFFAASHHQRHHMSKSHYSSWSNLSVTRPWEIFSEKKGRKMTLKYGGRNNTDVWSAWLLEESFPHLGQGGNFYKP